MNYLSQLYGTAAQGAGDGHAVLAAHAAKLDKQHGRSRTVEIQKKRVQ